jgi:NAD(P)-dependent dehydrogenase (short-subunit alcohol dehydrogenase family)
MARLQGKVAFITGAAGGVGSVASRLFAREGAKVLLAEIRDEGESIAAEINASGGKALFVKTDVTEPASIENAVQKAIAAFGKLDILYNNAGGSTAADGNLTDTSLEIFWDSIRFDLYSTYICCRFVIPEIIKAGGGSIINTGTTLAEKGLPGRDAYTAAKGGVVSLSRSIAAEHAKYNIRCNTILPAGVATPRVIEMLRTEPKMKQITDRQLLGMIDPLDIAYMALFLASDESRKVTAQTIGVDAGMLNT